MSDPVTNVEIEDVLSSIRRLVSSEQRDASEEDGGAEAQGEKGENRLVLTPAQRIDDAPEAGADLAEDAPEPAEEDDRFSQIEDAEIVEVAEEAEAADAGPPPEAEPEIARSEVPEFLRRAAFDRPGEPEEPEEQGRAGTDAAGEEQAESREEDEADLAAELESELDGIEPDGIDLKELEARVAGFETAVAAQDDEWEPDGDEGPASGYVAQPIEPLPWQDDDDDAQARATRAAEPLAADDAARTDRDREAEGAWYADDAILDEEALRDMVSEIVRQELQGALGERITRNVRKLVRREIHRALMSQGID